MESTTDKNLFKDLEDLGLGKLDNIQIYKENTEDIANSKKSTKKTLDTLFDRKLKCPVCECNFTVRAIRSSSIRMISQDTDLMPRYEGANPLIYDAWVCTKCGYAGLSNYFRNISHKQIETIKKEICAKWKSKEYPKEYDLDVAIERHKLTLLNAVVKNARVSEKAYICLKLAWIYRLKEDTTNEINFLNQALQGFEKAFEKESFPIASMDEGTLSYLIGETYKRIGKPDKALFWFSKILTCKTAKPRIKDMTRDQRYTLLEERKKQRPPQEASINNEKSKKGFIPKLFRT